MKETRIYCDICHRCIEGTDPSISDEQRLLDIWGSRTFRMSNPCIEEEPETELTLCNNCRQRLYYYIENKVTLIDDIKKLSLKNRIRLLFKMRLK